MPGRFCSSSALALLRSTRLFFAGALVSDLAGASFAGAAFACAHTAGLPRTPVTNASVTSRAANRFMTPSLRVEVVRTTYLAVHSTPRRRRARVDANDPDACTVEVTCCVAHCPKMARLESGVRLQA